MLTRFFSGFVQERTSKRIKNFFAIYVYLRVYLRDALIPLDNNDTERSIRSFCVGKHSWHIIDSVRGASASALLYSIAESAKANQLKPYEYFAYLLKELLKYPIVPFSFNIETGSKSLFFNSDFSYFLFKDIYFLLILNALGSNVHISSGKSQPKMGPELLSKNGSQILN